jgi:hypothetical protein
LPSGFLLTPSAAAADDALPLPSAGELASASPEAAGALPTTVGVLGQALKPEPLLARSEGVRRSRSVAASSPAGAAVVPPGAPPPAAAAPPPPPPPPPPRSRKPGVGQEPYACGDAQAGGAQKRTSGLREQRQASHHASGARAAHRRRREGHMRNGGAARVRGRVQRRQLRPRSRLRAAGVSLGHRGAHGQRAAAGAATAAKRAPQAPARRCSTHARQERQERVRDSCERTLRCARSSVGWGGPRPL